jgi:hypothetical protein
MKNKQDHTTYDNFCVTKIKHSMHNVQDYSVVYINAVICECWHVTHMWKALAHDRIVSEQFRNLIDKS